MFFDELFYFFFIEIADGKDRHQIRPVPIMIKFTQRIMRAGIKNFFFPDRKSVCVMRFIKFDRNMLHRNAIFCTPAQAPLLDHDTALFIDLCVVVRNILTPFFKDLKSFFKDIRRIGRYLQHIHRFIETGISVQIRSKTHAGLFKKVDKVLLGKTFCAVECHMFIKVCQALLVVVFENRTGFNGKPKLCAFFRFVILTDIVR